MSLTNSSGLSISGAMGAIAVLALGGAVACGSDFAGDDCKVSRTCPVAAGGQPDEAEPNETSGGTAQGGEAPSSSSGGAAGSLEGGAGAAELGDGGAPIAANAPPSVVSISPEGAATGIEPKTPIVITFSEPLAEASVTAESIKLLDGDSVVPGKLSYADGQVTFTPDEPLALLAGYEVAVESSVTDLDGAGLLEPFSSSFAVRDGTWRTVNAATGTFDRIADTLPLAANGDALLAWNVVTDPSHYCPTSARWFNRSKGLTTNATAFTSDDAPDCRWAAAGGNADGVAAVVWQDDMGAYAQQYRGSAWLPAKQTVSETFYSSLFRVAVAPNGAVSFFEGSGSGTMVSRSDAAGTWVAKSEVLSTEPALSPASIAFDAAGVGLASWRARDKNGYEKVVVSRYSSGKWASAVELPGSKALYVGANNQRGVPALAFDDAGGALALWVKELGNEGSLMASRSANGVDWAAPVAISGSQVVQIVTDAPALVFDGKTFVAAWTGKAAADLLVFSARFDMEEDSFLPAEPRTQATANLPRMPQLGADAHQNLLLVWATTNAAGAALVYQRFDARQDAWGSAKKVSDGTVNDSSFASSGAMPLSVNAGGLGALMWGDRNAQQALSTVRLASFY